MFIHMVLNSLVKANIKNFNRFRQILATCITTFSVRLWSDTDRQQETSRHPILTFLSFLPFINVAFQNFFKKGLYQPFGGHQPNFSSMETQPSIYFTFESIKQTFITCRLEAMKNTRSSKWKNNNSKGKNDTEKYGFVIIPIKLWDIMIRRLGVHRESQE